MKRLAFAAALSLASITAHAGDTAQAPAPSFIEKLIERVLQQQAPETTMGTTSFNDRREHGVVKK